MIILRKIGKIQINRFFLYFHLLPFCFTLGWRQLLDCTAPDTALPLGLAALRLGDLVVWWGSVEPLGPGAIVHGHVALATQEGCQGNLTRCDTLAARGRQRLREIHFLLTEYFLDLLDTLLMPCF